MRTPLTVKQSTQPQIIIKILASPGGDGSRLPVKGRKKRVGNSPLLPLLGLLSPPSLRLSPGRHLESSGMAGPRLGKVGPAALHLGGEGGFCGSDSNPGTQPQNPWATLV